MEYNITTNRTPNSVPEKSAETPSEKLKEPEKPKEAAPSEAEAKDKDSSDLIPEESVTVHHAGIPPGPLPAWDGRVESSWGDPRR